MMEIKPLKTTEKLVIESCELVPYNSSLKLNGTKSAAKLSGMYLGGNIKDAAQTFASVFEPEFFFYYNLVHYRAEKTLLRELGVGEIRNTDDGSFIDRKYCIFHQTGENDMVPSPSFYVNSIDKQQTSDEYFLVSYSPISNAMQLFLTPHSIPFTSPTGPSTVILEENSVLGRLNESLQSISIQDLLNKPTVIKSKKLPKNAEKGTIIIDSADGMIKIHNGEEWKTLKYEDS